MTLPPTTRNQKVRPIRVEGDVAYVTLTRGLVATIDAADVHLVEGRNWQAIPAPNTFYAAATIVLEGNKHKMVQMHRLIMDYPEKVDHRDGDGLRNVRSNLRAASHGQNMQNRKRTSSKFGLKGIGCYRGRFASQISINGKRVVRYGFDTAEDAARDYDAKAIAAFGEFAATNQSLGLL